MKIFDAEDFDSSAVVDELLDGGGAVRFPAAYDAGQVQAAREVIVAHTNAVAQTVSHFNQGDDEALLQRRVWNLLAEGEVFADMVQHPALVSTMRAFLGTDFTMGSICASRTMPGFRGQEPHIDYPYWDYHRQASFPARINASFPMNAQATIVIDPFTEASGATAYRPGSQKALAYPGPGDDFFDDYQLMLGQPGDLIVFFGLAWHCAMPNRTDAGRIGILIEFLPKFVKPVEDVLGSLDQVFVDRASPTLRQMLGLAYPWPSSPPHPPFTTDEPVIVDYSKGQ